MEYLKIVEKRVLSIKLNRNKIRTIIYMKHRTTLTNYKPEEVKNNKADSLDSFISFFQ